MSRYATNYRFLQVLVFALYVTAANSADNEYVEQKLMFIHKKVFDKLENEKFDKNLQFLLRPMIALRNNKVLSKSDDATQVDEVNDKKNTKSGKLSDNCKRQVRILKESMALKEPEASLLVMQIMDSSSKVSSGYLVGNTVDMGMYDECVNARAYAGGEVVRGRHCMYTIEVPSENQRSITLRSSVCVPHECTAEDVLVILNTQNNWNIVQNIADILNYTIPPTISSTIPSTIREKYNIAPSSAACSDVDVEVWDMEFIFCFIVLVAFVTFLLICTIVNIIKPEQSTNSALLALSRFSMKKSATSVLSLKETKDSFPALHGIRFLSTAWVVLGHEYGMQIFNVNINNNDIVEWAHSWKSLYIMLAVFAVDTFLTLSGFLTTYLFFKQMRKGKGLKLYMFYLHRYLRISPPAIAILVITIVFVPKIGSGAMWELMMSRFVDSCRTKWWTHLFFVQNFVYKNNVCLAHLWYLAVYAQLILITPMILYPMSIRPLYGLIILFVLFIASLAVPTIIVAINKYRPVSFIHEQSLASLLNIFTEVYIMPYNRAAPWLIGILLGYEVSNNNRRLEESDVFIGWFLTIGAFAFCTLGMRSFINPNYIYNPVWENFFNTFSKPIWSCAVCWIIYATISDHAGPVSTVLSWKIFLPLNRLSYCIYLVHLVLQVIFTASSRTPLYFSDWNIWREYVVDLIIAIIVAFFFSLLFESPIIAFEKHFLRGRQERDTDDQNVPPHGNR